MGDVYEGSWTKQSGGHSKAIAGYTSIGPLRIAMSDRRLNGEERMFILGTLARIHGVMGIKEAGEMQPVTPAR